MPTLPEILSQLQFITQEAALLSLFVTAGIILIGRDWRLLILALLTQYILVGLILSRLVRPDIAILKVMIGAFICPILFLSVRQVSFNPALISLLSKERRPRVSSTNFVFRLFAALLIILTAITLSKTFVLPGLSVNMTMAVYGLWLVGLTILVITENPFKVGHGLLTLLTGFDLFYTLQERSLLMTGLWGTINLLIALALSYLIVARGAGPEEEW
jgi:hypothetical protein